MVFDLAMMPHLIHQTQMYKKPNRLRVRGEVNAFDMSVIVRKQLCVSFIASDPRWLLARTFGSLENEARKARNPDVVARSIMDALGKAESSLLR